MLAPVATFAAVLTFTFRSQFHDLSYTDFCLLARTPIGCFVIFTLFDLGEPLATVIASVGWSFQCSRSCDGGVRMRHIVCQDAADREVPAEMCNPTLRHDREKCNEQVCTRWSFGDWTQVRAFIECRRKNGSHGVSVLRVMWRRRTVARCPLRKQRQPTFGRRTMRPSRAHRAKAVSSG